MNCRDRLIDLCHQANDELRTRSGCATWGDFADHLIANGVTIAADNNVGHKWIPVTERLPDTAESVLVCKTWHGVVYPPEYGYYQYYPNQRGCWYVLTEFGYSTPIEVTHWMPLPEPPKGE